MGNVWLRGNESCMLQVRSGKFSASGTNVFPMMPRPRDTNLHVPGTCNLGSPESISITILKIYMYNSTVHTACANTMLPGPPPASGSNLTPRSNHMICGKSAGNPTLIQYTGS